MIQLPAITPEFATERLDLKAIQESHIPDLFEMRSNPRTMYYLDRDAARTMADAEALYQRMTASVALGEAIQWGLFLKNKEKLIGYMGFWRMDKPNFRGEIGYMIQEDYQGKGFMQEAMDVVLKYCFESLRFHSIEADVNPNNKRSVALLEKNGFQREAYFKENVFHNGQFKDSAIYTLFSKFTHP